MTLVFYLVIDVLAIACCAIADANRNPEFRKKEKSLSYIRLSMPKYILFFALSFIVLCGVNILRNNVGADYAGYKNAYLHTINNQLTAVEVNWLGYGYRLLCFFVGFFAGDNYVYMFATVGFLTILLFYKAIYYLSDNWWLSLLLFICSCLYYQTFNQIRQMLAVAITTYAYRFLDEDKIIRFIFTIIIAASIHPSALLVTVLLFVRKVNMNWSVIVIYISAGILCFFGYSIIEKVLTYTNYGRTYLGWEKYNTSFQLSSLLNLVLRTILMIYCFAFAKQTIDRKRSNVGFYHAIIICTLLQVLTLKSYLFGRVTTYFFVFYIFLIPEVLKTIKENRSKGEYYINIVGCVLMLVVYHFVYYFSGSGAVKSGYSVYQSLIDLL